MPDTCGGTSNSSNPLLYHPCLYSVHIGHDNIVCITFRGCTCMFSCADMCHLGPGEAMVVTQCSITTHNTTTYMKYIKYTHNKWTHSCTYNGHTLIHTSKLWNHNIIYIRLEFNYCTIAVMTLGLDSNEQIRKHAQSDDTEGTDTNTLVYNGSSN